MLLFLSSSRMRFPALKILEIPSYRRCAPTTWLVDSSVYRLYPRYNWYVMYETSKTPVWTCLNIYNLTLHCLGRDYMKKSCDNSVKNKIFLDYSRKVQGKICISLCNLSMVRFQCPRYKSNTDWSWNWIFVFVDVRSALALTFISFKQY